MPWRLNMTNGVKCDLITLESVSANCYQMQIQGASANEEGFLIVFGQDCINNPHNEHNKKV
jgi:hypothetical protein